MKRLFIILQIILTVLFLYSCESNEANDAGAIKAPTNDSLTIQGVWKINDIKLIDEDIGNIEENMIGENIEISNKAIKIQKNVYVHPKFKLKIVDKSYVISYESGLTIEPFMNGKDKREIIRIVDNNNSICEFILLEDNKALILYRGMLLQVEKTSNNVSENLQGEKNGVAINNSSTLNEYYSDVGLMLALKTPRQEIDKGVYSKESYRTLWISFKEGKLQPIMQKDSIIFPRMKGIWRLENKSINCNGHEYEYFNAMPYEYENNSSNKVNSSSSNNSNAVNFYNNKCTYNVYKNIKFVGNDYIAIEKYAGGIFKNEFPQYEIIPIDNINSQKGVSINEIYSQYELEKYSADFNTILNKLSKEDKIKLNTLEDTSNFSLSRKDGKWNLIGKISPIDGQGSGVDFKLGFKVSKKLLNYNSLAIPWKVLRGELPFIKDAYTSPTGRLAIGIFKDNLAIYEIENERLKGSPLFNIFLNNGEEVIMAEWCSGSYVQQWEKAFKDGIEIVD